MDNTNTDLFADRDFWKNRVETLELENRNVANQYILGFIHRLKTCDDIYRNELRKILNEKFD